MVAPTNGKMHSASTRKKVGVEDDSTGLAINQPDRSLDISNESKPVSLSARYPVWHVNINRAAGFQSSLNAGKLGEEELTNLSIILPDIPDTVSLWKWIRRIDDNL
jgi:hypothetical protein